MKRTLRRQPAGQGLAPGSNDGVGEYGSGEVHPNTFESFFGVFKRGMKGVYKHCKAKPLHRYVDEFGSRYNNRVRLSVDDAERTFNALRGYHG